MAFPVSTYECYKLSNGTYVIRVYTVTSTMVGINSVPEGRQLTDEQSFPNQNALVAALKLLIG